MFFARSVERAPEHFESWSVTAQAKKRLDKVRKRETQTRELARVEAEEDELAREVEEFLSLEREKKTSWLPSFLSAPAPAPPEAETVVDEYGRRFPADVGDRGCVGASLCLS